MKYYDQLLALGLTMAFAAIAFGLQWIGLIESAERLIALLALFLIILARLKQNP